MLKTIINGNVGSVKFVSKAGEDGFQVLNFRVASHTTTKDGKNITHWVNAKLWGPRAKGLSEHLVKGQAVLLEGRPEARGYQDEDGTIKGDLTLHVTYFEFVGAKPERAPAEIEGGDAPVPLPTEE